MMKVKWQDFAKRRKLAIEDFAHMDYSAYAIWCSARRVEPIAQDLFPAKQKETPVLAIVEQEIAKDKSETDNEIISIPVKVFSFKSLSKMKKSQVQSICDDNSIDYTAASTKRQLVQKILELNIV
tara:strand:+ start:31 stop:405 length:375 start_codon:yes stop_codon:yes gene_type:complete